MPTTNCVIVGCSNSTYQLKKWKGTYCDIHHSNHGIGRCVCPPPFRLIPFPKDTEKRRQWVQRVSRKEKKDGKWIDWESQAYSRICSEHFLDGEPTIENPLPTLHLGHSHSKENTKRRKLFRRSVEVTEAPGNNSSLLLDEPSVTLSPASEEQVVEDQQPCEQEITTSSADGTRHDHMYVYWCTCSPMCCCVGCKQKEDKIRAQQAEINQLKEELEKVKKAKKKKESVTTKLLRTDAKVNFYTGLPDLATFYTVYHEIEDKATNLKYWRGAKTTKPTVRKYKATPKKQGPGRKTLLVDEFLLTLMKLRLDLFMEDLADRFGISTSSASNIFNTWVRFLRQELSKLIFFPDRDLVQDTMPVSFKAQDCKSRVIIDCTEVFIERPRDLRAQALTWSDYKKHNTVKFLVAITPQGHIAYISKAWGGRASDKHIVQQCGFLDLLDPGDEVMADRGFPIRDELLLRRAKLTMPPAAKGQEQMPKSDVEKTKHVANLRIHVERAINRIKWFRIMKSTLPITLLPRIDDISSVCSALCNLCPPLVE